MRVKNITLISISIQALIWMLIFVSVPLFVFLSTNSLGVALSSILGGVRRFVPWFVIFYLNYLWLVPAYFFGKNKWGFYLGNIAIFAAHIAIVRAMMPAPPPMPEEFHFDPLPMRLMSMSAQAFMQFVIAMLAIGFRAMMRYYNLLAETAQQKQQAAEAELQWLKSQLNPHFLFNTLNNISSLTQIDADKAQDSIGQLSDLLRYAMYDTAVEKVPLSGEIAFMRNYIDLMALRCNDLTKITTDFETDTGTMVIAPLLFICPVENAFKHGVNARGESFVDISLRRKGDDLVFESRNSVVGHEEVDRVGSGIGLANLKKRLELIYPDSFEYSCGADGGVYSCKITIKGIC